VIVAFSWCLDRTLACSGDADPGKYASYQECALRLAHSAELPSL